MKILLKKGKCFLKFAHQVCCWREAEDQMEALPFPWGCLLLGVPLGNHGHERTQHHSLGTFFAS